MLRVADLLARDLSRPVEEIVNAGNDDPDTVFGELTEYVATDRIKAEYERLFSAMAAASKSPGPCTGVWISGFFGSGKTSFAKNLGYVLANREVKGEPASQLFLKQMESRRITEYVEILNRTVPCETFFLDVPADPPAEANSEPIAEAMYRVMLRDLGYSEDTDRASGAPDAGDLAGKLFDLCQARCPGKTFAFIIDEMPAAPGAERVRELGAIMEQCGRENPDRMKAGKIPGPAWIIVTGREKPREVELQYHFKHRIDLSSAGIEEVAARRILRKKESHESILRTLFRDCGASLIQNVKLERCSRRTEFDEDRFVRYYPYPPHLIDLSLDIMAGIRLHPDAPGNPGDDNRTLVKQSFEMLVSRRTRLADQPVGVLVSIDKIYDLVESNIPAEKQKTILDIRQSLNDDEDYPGMAARVAKAICLMEFAKTDLPRTTRNIAALLIRRVTEAPPTLPVAQILHLMREAQFVRETEDGWELYGLDELRRSAARLEGLGNAVGIVNPRSPGWHNDLIQLAKKTLARALTWYTRPLHEFNSSVGRMLKQIIWAIDHLSTNSVAPQDRARNQAELDRLGIDVIALDGRVAESEKRLREQIELLQEQVKALAGLQNTAIPQSPARENFRCYVDPRPGNARTAYVIGLFGTGRRYINELMLRNIGERAKYFRDAIRVHPGPTPMIYSGHATMRHVSRAQELPAVMNLILKAAGSGFADLIFVYRHPLDSLLTNWIWWRTYLRSNRAISGVSELYKNADELSADLERNFSEFESFAEGDPYFFAGVPGPRFLSFSEFVEETELHFQAATLALRLEDFIVDPHREFSKIAAVMSVDLDLSRLNPARPRTRPYGHLAVRDRVPRFRNFIDGLDEETKRRIGKFGFPAGI